MEKNDQNKLINPNLLKIFYIQNELFFEEYYLNIVGRKIKILNNNMFEKYSYIIDNILEIFITESKYELKVVFFNKISFIIKTITNINKITEILLKKKKNITIQKINTKIINKYTKLNTLYLENNNKKIIVEKNDKKIKNIYNGFLFLKLIDKGAFSKVYLVKEIQTQNFYAIKVIKKELLEDNNEYYIINNEYKIIKNLKNKFLIDLKFSFQDNERIYFGFEYFQGGNLFNLITKNKKISEEYAKFYLANIIISINYLHSKNYIYKDLKLENILIGEDGYLKLIDFGLCQYLSKNEKCYSFSGTPEYLAPEVILLKGHNKAADYWSIGIILYELLFGIPPFYSNQISKMYVKIVKENLAFKEKIQISDSCKDLILKLLEKNPDKRLQSMNDIINHDWFKEINFKEIILKNVKPPYTIKNKINIKESKKDLLKKINNDNENKKTFTNQNIDNLKIDFLNGIENIV